MICSNGHDVQDGFAFCPRCGIAVAPPSDPVSSPAEGVTEPQSEPSVGAPFDNAGNSTLAPSATAPQSATSQPEPVSQDPAAGEAAPPETDGVGTTRPSAPQESIDLPPAATPASSVGSSATGLPSIQSGWLLPPIESSPSRIDSIHASIKAKPVALRVLAWVLFLPLMAALVAARRYGENPSPERRMTPGMLAALITIVGSAIFYPGVIAAGGSSPKPEAAPPVVEPTYVPPTETEIPTPGPVAIPSTRLVLPTIRPLIDDHDSVALSGTSSPGALIVAEWRTNVKRSRADKVSGKFKMLLRPFPFGTTEVTLTATAANMEETTDTISVVRRLSPGRVASAFKSKCKSIAYDTLKKDPDALAGRAVMYRAKVFQYDARTTTSTMLVEVSPQGYGYWDDLVFLTLDPKIARRIDEEDIIRFWGVVEGAYTYETAASGSNTIPQVEVRYMQLLDKN